MSDAREMINFRIGTAGLKWIDETARKHRTTRSAVIRTALSIARRHEVEMEHLLSGADFR